MSNTIWLRTTVLCLLAVATACGKGERPERQKSEAGAPVKVTIETVHAAQEASSERVPGSVRPRIESTIEAKVPGRVSEISVRLGEAVKKGEQLVVIDAREMQARLEQAEASLQQAEQDLGRFSKLLPAGAVTRQEYDAAVTRQRLAQASVAEAKAMVGYTRIQAPFDGVITEKLAEPGDLAVPGKPLVRMQAEDSYRFEADVPETAATGLTMGKSLTIRLAGLDSDLTAVVSEISPKTDANSRTLHIKLDLPNNPVLRSGQFGYVLVDLSRRPVLRIPVDAFVQRGQMEIVFVAQDGQAVMRLVRTGKREDGQIEVLSGLSDGETVIVSQVQKLVDGTPIEVAAHE